MVNKKIFGIFVFMMFLLVYHASAYCIVKGNVYDSIGRPVQGARVEVKNLANNIVFDVNTVQGIFVKPLFSCIIDKDVIEVKVIHNGVEKITTAIAAAPTTEVEFSLNSLDSSIGLSSGSSGGFFGGSTESNYISENFQDIEEEKKCSTIITKQAKSFEMNNCSKAIYYHKGKRQAFKIENMDRQKVLGKFEPLGSYIMLFIKETKSFDLDGNGAYDIEIKFLDIEDNVATLSFSSIEEKFPEPEKTIVELHNPSRIKLSLDNIYGINTLLLVLILANAVVLVYYLIKNKTSRK